jgi:hypothetical protein
VATRQRRARRNIRKGVEEAKRQRTIVRLSKQTRRALKTKGAKAARRKRKRYRVTR